VLERLFALEMFGIKLGLENITSLCADLDHPERAFTSLIVGGTNGKGSVTAMVHAGLIAAGVRAARYTSPHLSDLRERFVIGRDPVDQSDLEDAATHVLDRADRLVASGGLYGPPTFFEATTAIAFELFRRARVEVAVLEVGLGGRFDATNVVAAPAGAITSIGLDHERHLGSTLESIAFEKAGIIKQGMTVVIGRLPAPARGVIANCASERGAVLVDADEDVTMSSRMEEGRAILDVTTPLNRYRRVPLALRGEHQIGNALVALRLMEAAGEIGISIPRDAIERGLADVDWPARLEVLRVPEGELVIDAAHNPDGAAALAAYLLRWHPGRPTLVFAAMRDKNIDGILRALLPAVGTVMTTAPSTHRAAPPSALAARIHDLAPEKIVVVEPDPLTAVRRAFEHGRTVVVAGSIFLAGAIRGPFVERAILRPSSPHLG
jgi:dihydrofolate synthase/folylpolyglutamate synthase